MQRLTEIDGLFGKLVSLQPMKRLDSCYCILLMCLLFLISGNNLLACSKHQTSEQQQNALSEEIPEEEVHHSTNREVPYECPCGSNCRCVCCGTTSSNIFLIAPISIVELSFLSQPGFNNSLLDQSYPDLIWNPPRPRFKMS